MPVIVDNNFSLDTYGNRTERLLAIQGNFALVQPDLLAPDNIADWAETCYDDYALILSTSTVEGNESEGATVVVAEKESILDEIYQNVKNMGLTIYKDKPELIQDYGFEFLYPIRRDEKINKVDSVINIYNKNVDSGVTPLIPALMITRLTTALEDFKTAIQNQDTERYEARHAVNALSDRFVADTQKLNELKLWWYAMKGKKDAGITLIGMVNPQSGGGAPALPAPTGLAFDLATRTFSWSAVPNAVSYQIQYTLDNQNWIEIYAGPDISVVFEPNEESLYRIKVRAHNANGYSIFSQELALDYEFNLLPPDSISVSLANPATHLVALNWGAVDNADFYRLYTSAVAIGAPSGAFTLVGEYSILSHSSIVSTNQRHYYYIISGNSVSGLLSPASIETFIDVA